jgi:hypothetical protein
VIVVGLQSFSESSRLSPVRWGVDVRRRTWRDSSAKVVCTWGLVVGGIALLAITQSVDFPIAAILVFPVIVGVVFSAMVVSKALAYVLIVVLAPLFALALFVLNRIAYGRGAGIASVDLEMVRQHPTWQMVGTRADLARDRGGLVHSVYDDPRTVSVILEWIEETVDGESNASRLARI